MSSDLLKEFASPPEESRFHGTRSEPTDTVPVEEEEEEEEEDFGEFENPKADIDGSIGHIPAADRSSSEDDDANEAENYSVIFDADQLIAKQIDQIHSAHPKETATNSKTLSQITKSTAKATPTPTTEEKTEFENWPEIYPDSIPPTSAPKSGIPVESTSSYVRSKFKDSGPPPSNVPPPSILLPLVARVFHSLAADVRMIVSSGFESSAHSSRLDQAKIYQLKDALGTARAGARIIAGRKLRWKRDSLLSQSMKIGPAIGKSGGMKLVGLDRTESRREDAEAAEAIRIWKQQVGSLRSAVSNSNLQVTVPDISEAMPIRVIKANEGALTAPRCCFLCGVKRDERIAKVDVNVEDSFGEWWTEYWGHVDCSTFWTDHKGSLSQR